LREFRDFGRGGFALGIPQQSILPGFEANHSKDEYDRDAITHLLGCCADFLEDWPRGAWGAC